MYGKAEITPPSGKGITKGMARMTADQCWGSMSFSPSASNLDSCPEWELIAALGGGMLWGAWAGQGSPCAGQLVTLICFSK